MPDAKRPWRGLRKNGPRHGGRWMELRDFPAGWERLTKSTAGM